MAKLVRVDDKTYSRLHKLAGKLQAANGKRTSLCEAIRRLLDGGKPRAAKKQTPGRAKKKRKKHGAGQEAELVPYFQRREIH